MIVRLIVLLFVFLSFNAVADTVNGFHIKQIEKLTGAPAFYFPDDHVVKVKLENADWQISLNGIQLAKTTSSISSYVTFKKAADLTFATGEIALSEDQVNPVLSVVLKNGFTVTGLDNHFLWESPRIEFLHFEGQGDEKTLAKNVGNVFDKVKETRNGKGDFIIATIDPAETTLNIHKLNTILGAKGTLKEGVYKITFSRHVTVDSNSMDGSLAQETWATFIGKDDKAIMNGEIAILDSELQNVLTILREANIDILSIDQRLSSAQPQYIFLHYFGVGRMDQLAKGLRKAMDSNS